MKRQLLLIIFLSFAFYSVSAVIQEDSMQVYAVTTDDQTALSAGLSLEIKPGSGKVWSSVEPLIGTSTQTTEKIAVEVAKTYFGRVKEYDYFFEIESEASLVDGPSAGAAMGLLLISMLQDRNLPDDVSITGTITVDGGVGPVGGVFKKAQKAAATGVELFMIPRGESKQIVKLPEGVRSINLSDYAKNEWGIVVVEVSNIDQALKYAFSDIESIDINRQSNFMPDFLPEVIPLSPQLEQMDSLTERYLVRAEVALGEARTALSGTLLTEPDLVDAMLSLLNESEKTLEQARRLDEENYLYSAANYSFLAIVNVSLVKSISDNPSLLENNSTIWDLKILNLRREINSLKRDLNSSIPIDQFEWHIAAKERLTWAEEKLNKVEKNQEQIVITVGDSDSTEKSLESLADFEYASAWVTAARDFYALTVSSEKRIANDRHFENLADSYLVTVEDSMSLLTDEEKEDVLRRFESAKLARQRGWYMSALFDAVSALSLANASIYVKNKSLEEVDKHLEEKIEALQEEIALHETKFVWPQLYLDHAIYYKKGVDFYKEQGENSRALDMAQNGISLVFLAEAIFDVTSETDSYLGSIPESRFIFALPFGEQSIDKNLLYLLVLVALLAVATVVLSVILLKLSKKLRASGSSLNRKIDEIRRQQESLEGKLHKRKISQQEFDSLSAANHAKLSHLLDEKSELSRLLVEVDHEKAMLLGFEQALRSIKKQRKKGLLTESDYLKNFDYYNKQIVATKKAISLKDERIKLAEQAAVQKQAKSPMLPAKLLPPLPTAKKKPISFKKQAPKQSKALQKPKQLQKQKPSDQKKPVPKPQKKTSKKK